VDDIEEARAAATAGNELYSAAAKIKNPEQRRPVEAMADAEAEKAAYAYYEKKLTLEIQMKECDDAQSLADDKQMELYQRHPGIISASGALRRDGTISGNPTPDAKVLDFLKDENKKKAAREYKIYNDTVELMRELRKRLKTEYEELTAEKAA